MNQWAIECHNVTKSYRHFNLNTTEFKVATGSIMGLIGVNGAGKSTLMRILLGLIHQDHGEVQVLGHPMPADQVQAKQNVGYVSEDMRLYGMATLAWHMHFMAGIYPQWDQAYANDILKRFDLKAEQKIKGMSHGQRVKAALLLALARRPRLLILDEPTTGLDPVARHELLSVLMEVLADEERTVLFSSHNTLDVEQISDAITFIDAGRVLDSDDKESFLERWRRVRLEVPTSIQLPTFDGMITKQHSGKIATITTNRYSDQQAHTIQQTGARILETIPMTLEEIFVATVQHQRGSHA